MRTPSRLAACLLTLVAVTAHAVCPNGVVEPPETCDDGNLVAGDGCSPLCLLEVPNLPPICDRAYASVPSLWPPNHRLVPIGVKGVVDPDGDPVTVTVTGVWQDEPVNGTGDGGTCPDATGVGTHTVALRAERAGGGDGRVYHVAFDADDGLGGSCAGAFVVCVPHDQGRHGRVCGDGGPLFDSTAGDCPPDDDCHGAGCPPDDHCRGAGCPPDDDCRGDACRPDDHCRGEACRPPDDDCRGDDCVPPPTDGRVPPPTGGAVTCDYDQLPPRIERRLTRARRLLARAQQAQPRVRAKLARRAGARLARLDARVARRLGAACRLELRDLAQRAARCAACAD